jgi:hypothetical protein
MNDQPDWLEGMMNGILQGLNRNRRKPISAPKFDGTTDVRAFLKTFLEVAEKNDWDDEERALQLKLVLSKSALECLQGDTVEEMGESLITRYESTKEEARRDLRNLKLKPGQDIHQFANMVMKLVKITDPELDGEDLDERATTELIDAIGDRHLTREFRLMRPINFADAIKRIQQYNSDMRVTKVRRLGEDCDEEVQKLKLQMDQLQVTVKKIEEDNKTIKETMEKNKTEICKTITDALKQNKWTGPQGSGSQGKQGNWNNGNQHRLICYNCQKPGHISKDCWAKKRPNNNKPTENY